MYIRNLLLFGLTFSLLRPIAVQAQEKFEINVGISNPGLYSLADRDIFGEGGRYEFRGLREHVPEERQLASFDLETYNSVFYPSISANIVYKLADSGFFKRLSAVGFLGYHMVGFENFDPVTKHSNKETAVKLDYLLGIRIRLVDKENFCLYSQLLAGNDFRNDCEYWTIAHEFVGSVDRMDYQVTFIGGQFDFGKNSQWGVFGEYGFGYEYAISRIFIFPGMRAGVTYKF